MTAYLAEFQYNAVVVEVQDGDTVDVQVDWGFRRYEAPVPIRLLGLACRELKLPGGPEARDYVAGLLPPGTPVLLRTAKPDKYAPRWDAQLWYRSPGGNLVDLGSLLITQGWALPWNGRGAQPVPPWPRRAAA